MSNSESLSARANRLSQLVSKRRGGPGKAPEPAAKQPAPEPAPQPTKAATPPKPQAPATPPPDPSSGSLTDYFAALGLDDPIHDEAPKSEPVPEPADAAETPELDAFKDLEEPAEPAVETPIEPEAEAPIELTDEAPIELTAEAPPQPEAETPVKPEAPPPFEPEAAAPVEPEVAPPVAPTPKTESDGISLEEAAEGLLRKLEALADEFGPTEAAATAELDDGRVRYTFDAEFSAVIRQVAEQMECSPEDVITTGVNFYISELYRDSENDAA